MPFSVKQIRCRVDPDLDDLLFDFQERLGEQYLGAQSVLAELTAIAASVESDILDPARSDLDQVLAVADTSSVEMEDAMGLVLPGESAEFSIGDRYDITVVNGRVIPSGDLDISAIKTLTRVVGGGVFGALRFIPELDEMAVNVDAEDRRFVGDVRFPPRFIFVSTYIETTITPATSCTPEIVVEREITAGVEIPVEEAAASAGVSVEDLRLYIFWLGYPDAGPRMRAKARSMGLTNDQFVDAVSLSSSEGFFVGIIHPMDILRLVSAFGEDTDDVIPRVSGPISLDSSDVIDSIRDTFGRSSGAITSEGFRDWASPAAAILSVLDIDKTFRISEVLAGLGGGDPALPATQFISGITAAIQSQLLAFSSILTEAQGILAGVLTNLSNLQSMVFNIFSDLSSGAFDCLFGAGFSAALGFPPVGAPGVDAGLPGVPGVSTENPLEGLISTIEGQATLVRSFTSSLGDLFGSISSISCMGSFLSGAFTIQNSFPGSFLECASAKAEEAGLELPESVLDALGTVKEINDFLSGLFDFAISNTRGLRLTAVSLGLSIRETITSRSPSASLGVGGLGSIGGSGPSAGGGCAPPEAARLVSVLQSRASAGFTSSGGS
jgi:hypothetical protein